MLGNVLEDFSDKIFLFLVGETKSGKCLLVKKHSENLQLHGDFSFPNTVNSWHQYLDSKQTCGDSHDSFLKCIGMEVIQLVEKSQKWALRVKKTKEENGRIHLFLDRSCAFRVGLSEALVNNNLISLKLTEGKPAVQYDPLCEHTYSLTFLRLKCLTEAIENLCILNKINTNNIFVTSKSSTRHLEDNKVVLCGAVLNAKSGVKETSFSTDDFIRIRQDEMTLIAQHKYGVRVATDSKWKEFIKHLGESAVAFELLQTRPSNAVKINFDCYSAGSSKGAAFILYNCARLETIVRTYNEKVNDGTYPPLPDFDSTDFNLLTHEDEWCLVFNFVMGFPSLLKNCVDVSGSTCEFRPHRLCNFLCAMVRVFSQYYRKIRILTEPRKHLLPVMFARIHMLKILNETLKTCLKILNIKSVCQM